MYAPPPASPDLLGRVRLDGRYRAGVGRVIRIVAPAGYGKTSLAARWVSGDDRHVRWVDVELAHNDPAALLAEIRAALTGIVDVARPATIDHDVPDGRVDIAHASLAAALRADHEPFVIVFDDVHRLDDTMSVWLLDGLAEHLPSSSTIVMVGRSRRDEWLDGRLRLTPGLVDVTIDDLRLDVSESFRLLQSMGVTIGDPELVDVVEALEGWPAGLRLAGEAMLAGASVDEVLDDRLISDYLRSEWTNRLGHDDVAFLQESACLGHFTGALCDRVLGRSGSAQLLDRMHRDELIVLPIDRRGEAHRLHPLLQRGFAGQLRQSAPERWTEIHRTAALEFETDGEIDRAFEHAAVAGQFDICEALIMRHGALWLAKGRSSTVMSWFAAIPVDRVRSSPGLCAVRSITAVLRDDEYGATQWLRLADDAVRDRLHLVDRHVEEVRWVTVMHACLDEGRAGDLESRLRDTRDELVDAAWGVLADLVLAGLRSLDGDHTGAFAALARGIFEADLAGAPLLGADCLAMASVLHGCEGDWAAAGEEADRAVDVMRSHDIDPDPLSALLPAVDALLYARSGDHDAARASSAVARRALTSFRMSAPWLNVIARIPLVRASLLLDDREASRSLADEVEFHARFEADGAAASGAVREIRDLRRQVDAMHRPALGATALTEAEWRVLHYLPTNLSLADIATRLYVSRNTVKSQVANIYRKLDVENRAAAVERAQFAGLITG